MTTKPTTTPVCRALDLGYGFTKFSQGDYKDDATLELSAFPSYAVPTTGHALAGTTSQNVIHVTVGAQKYAVGEQAALAAGAGGRQTLESRFFKSNQYLALARGAFAFMRVPSHGTIDHLVAGLPLDIFQDDETNCHVQRALLGEHVVPDVGRDDGASRTLQVKEVTLIPQVVGSLIAMSQTAGLMDKVQSQMNLTVDVGYGTLLWLTTQGFTPLQARCSGNMGGVSSILQTVVRAMQPGAETNLATLSRLDRALLEGLPSISIFSDEVCIADYRDHQAHAVAENLTELVRSVGPGYDIQNIFLTGGGSHLYRDAIQSAFPKHKVLLSSDEPRFSNVRGFQTLAQGRC